MPTYPFSMLNFLARNNNWYLLKSRPTCFGDNKNRPAQWSSRTIPDPKQKHGDTATSNVTPSIAA